MKKILLLRTARNNHGTWGNFIDSPLQKNIPFALSAELPWKDNEKNISCIPAGNYDCEWTIGPQSGKEKILIKNVPGRTSIYIEIANCPLKQLLGCIAIGEMFENVWNQQAIQKSKEGFEELKRRTNRESFILCVRDHYYTEPLRL